MLTMKARPSKLGNLDIQAQRVAAMTVVIGVHSVMALALFAYGTPLHQRKPMSDGGASTIKVSFVSRVASVAHPSPPPPPPIESPAKVEQPRIEPVQTVRVEEVVAQPQVVQPAAYAFDDSEDDGSLPIMTADPTVAAVTTAGPMIFDADQELPGEFLAEVDARPMELAEFRNTSAPVYLDEAKEAREQGIVVLRVLIDELGFPTGIQVVKSTAGQLLTQETIRAVSEWQFKPAEREGMRVKGVLLVPVAFFLDGLPPKLRNWKSAGTARHAST